MSMNVELMDETILQQVATCKVWRDKATEFYYNFIEI